MHLLPLLVIFTGITWTAVALFAVTYFGRMWVITAGYHRYFSHRSYRLARFPQFVLAFLGTTCAEKGPLWWAAHHRVHHRAADTDADLHSPRKGFWWSHVGWILCDRYGGTDVDEIKDFSRFPELRFLNKHDWIGPWSLGVTCYLIGGWSGLVVGFFASTILLWHTTFLVNSAAHIFGRRSYETTDTSRNSMLIALGHRRRGLAQQPPPLPFVGAPGLSLVADRHDVLRAQGAGRARHREGPASRSRAHPRRSPPRTRREVLTSLRWYRPPE